MQKPSSEVILARRRVARDKLRFFRLFIIEFFVWKPNFTVFDSLYGTNLGHFLYLSSRALLYDLDTHKKRKTNHALEIYSLNMTKNSLNTVITSFTINTECSLTLSVSVY